MGKTSSEEKITIQSAAKILGVSKGTVVHYLNNGKLTRFREGSKVYREYTKTGKGTGILLDVIGNRQYIKDNVITPIVNKLTERFIEQMQTV